MRKLAIVCGVLCAMATLHVAQYATEVKNLYVDSKDSKVVGKLLPTTEVQVIKKENGRVLLAVQGYADANLNLAVYFVPGKRIFSVGLTKDSGIALKKQSSVQADGKTYQNAQKANVVMADGNLMPDFQIFWSANRPLVFDATLERLDFVRYADFREDPILNPLGTPSGRIEIYSEVIEKMNYKDCKAFPQWFELAEWKGMKDKPAEFALLSPHPSLRLHSQLANTRLRDEYAVVNREPIWINPADAKAKDIQNGDLVRVFNKRGQIIFFH